MNLSSINQNLLSRIFSRGINKAEPTKNQFSATLLNAKNSTKSFGEILVIGKIQVPNAPASHHTQSNYSTGAMGKRAGKLFFAENPGFKSKFNPPQLSSTYSTNAIGKKAGQSFTADNPFLKQSTMKGNEHAVSDLLKPATSRVGFDLTQNQVYR